MPLLFQPLPQELAGLAGPPVNFGKTPIHVTMIQLCYFTIPGIGRQKTGHPGKVEAEIIPAAGFDQVQ